MTNQRIVIVLGLIVLCIVVWVSIKSRFAATVPGPVATAASMGIGSEAVGVLPQKVVTMLGVPEVILSSTAAAPEVSAPSKGKPSIP